MRYALRPRRSHPISVEPDPPNRSTTRSPALLLFTSARSISSTGFIVGCRRFAAGLFSSWDSASPKFIMGGSDEEKFDHPTQKPVDLMRRPILNHTKRGQLVYEPFLGSGTTLAAAELTERVCCGIELEAQYVDVVVQRWQTLSGKLATLEGDGRTFVQVAEERRKETAAEERRDEAA